MRRIVTALALATPLAACGVSKEVYLQKEAELAACRTNLGDGETALAQSRAESDARARDLEACRRGEEACRQGARDLETCLAEAAALRREAGAGAEAEAARKRAEAEAAACAETRSRTEADLVRVRGEAEAAHREVAELKQREAELRARLEKEIQDQTVEIERLRSRLSVRVVDRILFDTGSAEILKAGKAVLDKVALVVAGTSERIRVEGHTDDVPISRRLKPKFFSNWELSAARAANVVRYFEYAKGVDPARMEAVGLASYRPDVPNDSFEGRAQNRRVVIVLTPPPEAPTPAPAVGR